MSCRRKKSAPVERRASDLGVQGLTDPTNGLVVDQRPDPAQRIVVRHEALERKLIEQRTLRIRLPHHRLRPPARILREFGGQSDYFVSSLPKQYSLRGGTYEFK